MSTGPGALSPSVMMLHACVPSSRLCEKYPSQESHNKNKREVHWQLQVAVEETQGPSSVQIRRVATRVARIVFFGSPNCLIS